MKKENNNPNNPKDRTLEALDQIEQVLKNSLVDLKLKYNGIVEELNEGAVYSDDVHRKIIDEEIGYLIKELRKVQEIHG